MSQSRTIKELQKALKCTGKKDADKITHTRIGDKDNNIYGGSYIVTEEFEEQWYNAIYNEVIQGNIIEYLTEKQYTDGPLYVDLDLHYSTDITTRQHNDEWIENIVAEYLNAIQECCEFQGGEKMTIYVMQKDGVNRLQDKTKDGLHILFGVKLPRGVHKLIRKKVMDSVDYLLSELPLKNDAEAIFDEGITKGGTNIQVFGCRKPAHEPYKLYKIYNCELDASDMNWMMPAGEKVIMTPELFWELSVRNLNRPEFPLKKQTLIDIDPLSSLRNKRQAELIIHANFEDKDDLHKLFSCFTSKRINEYETWTPIAWALMNSLGKEAGREWITILNSFCPQRNNISDNGSAIDWFDKQEPKQDGVTIKSLHYWAKQDNPEQYAQLFPKQNKVIKQNNADELMNECLATNSEVSIARLFVALFGDKFKCINIKNRIFYEFTNYLWTQDESGSPLRNVISNELYKEFQTKQNQLYEEMNLLEESDTRHEAIKKKTKIVHELCQRLMKTNDKNNILREICDLIKDVEFEKDMNREQFKLPIKNGKLLDMRTLEVTERTIANKFNYECDVIYKELSEEENMEAEAYFSSLFCGHLDTMQVVLNILKSVMTGRPLRYIYFITGCGRNGKSVLLNLLDAIFKKGIDVISKDVILKKKSNSHLNTEIEKLGKCRLGYTTELKEEDELNETTIKQITGGDKINVRSICKTDETLETTCNLAVVTNELPKFKVEQAIVDRIIVIPFNNRFEVVDNFKDNIISKKDIFFSFIMKHGIIQDKFDLTPEMKAATDDYKLSNDKDYLKEFYENTFEKVNGINPQTNNPYRILKTDFRMQLLGWLKMNDYHDNKTDQKQITKRMTEFGIEGQRSNGKDFYINIKTIDAIDD